VFCLVTSCSIRRSTLALDLACCYPTGGYARPSSATTRRTWEKASRCCGRRTPRADAGHGGRCSPSTRRYADHRHRGGRGGHPPARISFPHAWPPRRTPSRLSPLTSWITRSPRSWLKILYARLLRPRPPRRATPLKTRSRRLPRPQARRAQHRQRPPAESSSPALHLADNLKSKAIGSSARNVSMTERRRPRACCTRGCADVVGLLAVQRRVDHHVRAGSHQQ